MFNNFTVGLILGIGAGGWVYNKMMRRTGGNTVNSLLTAAFCGIIGFIVVLTVLSAIF